MVVMSMMRVMMLMLLLLLPEGGWRHGADARDAGVAAGHRGVERDDRLRLQTEQAHVADVAVAVADPDLAGDRAGRRGRGARTTGDRRRRRPCARGRRVRSSGAFGLGQRGARELQ